MDLVYSELLTGGIVQQEIKMTADVNLKHIRPHIFKKNNPAGSLRIDIKDQGDHLIASSNVITIASISTFNFAHGYLKFDIATPLKKDLIYFIELVGIGYTFTESDHIGFCKDFDLRKVTPNYTPNAGLNSALDLELWGVNVGTRVVEFFDGFESNSSPTQGSITATSLFAFANDAAYVAAVGRAAIDGDMYRNTTIGLLQIHDGTKFEDIPIQDIPETQATILNAETGPTDVVGLVLSSSDFHSGTFKYTLLRTTATQEEKETGVLKLSFEPGAGVWSLARESDFENTGVTFTIVAGTGQVQYSSNDLTGGSHVGIIKFKTIKAFAPGV